MKIPDKFPALKDPKNGYKWEARGLGWHSENKNDFAIINNDSPSDFWAYCKGGGSIGMQNLYYVEQVPVTPSRPTLEEQITKAKSMVGKTFLWKNAKFTVATWHVTNQPSHKLHGGLVVDEVLEFGVSVYIMSEDKAQYPVLCEDLTEFVAPSYREVVLNRSYTAKVYADKIEVGCQTFPISVLSELLNLHKKLKES